MALVTAVWKFSRRIRAQRYYNSRKYILLRKKRARNVEVRWHFIRQLVEWGGVEVVYIGAKQEHDNVLTNALHARLFNRHLATLRYLPS